MKLLAPNGKPSNLNKVQYHLVRTPEFKAWFGDWENSPETASKVVDSNGEPKVMYHSSDSEFTIFNPEQKSKWTNQRKEKAIWFGGNNKVSSYTNNGYLYEVFLCSFNPIIVDAKDYDSWNYYYDENNNKTYDIGRIKGRFITQAKEVKWDGTTNNNDGVLFLNAWDNVPLGIVCVVFEPEQIKLADGSNTTFDSNNPDIRFDNGGEIENLISQGIIDLKFYETTKEHAKEYGLKSNKPIFVQNLCVSEKNRLKGIGNKVLEYIENYAQKNGNDVIFGYVSEKATMTKDNRTGYFTEFKDVDWIKHWLFRNGYCVRQQTNDFYKVLDKEKKQIKLSDGTNTIFDSNNPDIRFDYGGNVLTDKMPTFIAPNGNRSNLIGIKAEDENGRWVYLYDLVRSNKFKEFFGDWEEAYITKDYDYVSKIIDENGEPSICYHTTSNEFYEFSENFIGSRTDAGYYGKGFYFTEGTPDSHYGEREIPCFLNIRNPFLKQSSYRNYELNTEDLKNKGFDGVIVFSDIESVDLTKGLGYRGNRVEEIVAYYPEQIKLADATNTTFDRYDSDIRYEQGGVVSDELAKIKESYDFGFEYFEGEIYGQDYKIRMNKNHPRNAYRNDDQFIHNLSLVNVEYPSAVVFREENNKVQIQKDKIYSWEDAESEIREFFYEIEDRSNQYKKGGSLSKTPAPKKERIYGSKVNKPKSSESKSKASSIILSPNVIKSINSILEKHNEKSNKKIPLATAKAVVRRGMGAYSSTHRPTIKGGKPNSRVAWGLARLNAFVYKIQKGHSKSGKYSQDNDLINELGYRVSKFDDGGNIESLYKDHHDVWAESEKIIKDVCEENCSKYSDKIYHLYELELKPHFEEEENDFFPKALNDTNKKAIEDLIKEHSIIADLCKTIRLHKKTSDIKLFCALIKNHIKKEEEIMNKITPDPYKKEENKDFKYYLVLKNKKPVFKVKFSKYNKETERDMSAMLDKLHDMNYMLKLISEKEYNEFDYKNVNKDDVAEFTRNWTFYKEGGVITDEQEETYNKWKKLVNMTPSELKKFLDSEEGKVAGLTSKEADELGIDYGRESAKWILKMKAIPYKEWTPNMWRWAKKQISFISRMTGNKGKLYDEKGNRTRKYLSLLVWGNNPLKNKK